MLPIVLLPYSALVSYALCNNNLSLCLIAFARILLDACASKLPSATDNVQFSAWNSVVTILTHNPGTNPVSFAFSLREEK